MSVLAHTASLEALGAVQNEFQARVPPFSGKGLRVASVEPPPMATLRVPGSKSFTNRAAVLAGLCPLGVTLEGVLFSDDSWWAFDSLARLGFRVEPEVSLETVHISPPGVPSQEARAAWQGEPVQLHFGMAGTLARFFPAVILNYARTFPNIAASFAGRTMDVLAGGAPRLCERPLSELVFALRSLGANISSEKLPSTFTDILAPSRLSGGCSISGKTSGQFLSGLLLASAGSRNAIDITRVDSLVQPDYVRMTVRALEAFGAEVVHDSPLTSFRVHCPQGLAANRFVIEADASTACYFMAFAALYGIDLTLTNIGSSTLQPDLQFTAFLERLGVPVEVKPGTVRVIPRPGFQREGSVGVATPGSKSFVPFHGGFEVDFHACSDQALTAGVLALFADAPIRVFGVEHIRGHESDRIASLVKNLGALGIACAEAPDGFTVVPPALGTQLQGPWETHHDHRFGMTGFLVGSCHPGVEILSPGCVEKTAPDFFFRMARLGARYA
ncbi:MAG: 3-phosphoshikimate 1-carboxyvinyltransferase [Silvanigrellales bacterium]|nr:3-phosphoshikimate 1-carboxyvinyltransferase [Silvanigrellales bacterium]